MTKEEIQASIKSIMFSGPILQMMQNLTHQKMLQTIRKNFMRLV